MAHETVRDGASGSTEHDKALTVGITPNPLSDKL